MRTVIALGGNAIASGAHPTVADQRARIRETVGPIRELTQRGYDVVLTHGNGPQVGTLLLQQEQMDAPERPLDVLVAETQAQIGYLLAGELDDRLDTRVVTLLTRVHVDPDDPDFENPSKPVGPHYSETEAAAKPFETGPVRRPDGERAYRRLVPSPRPQEVLEADEIQALVERGATVVCGGGGGVPVVDTGGGTEGVEAVVDKDHTTSLLAREVDAETLVMATDVEYVYRDFGTAEQEPIEAVDAAAMGQALDRGEFSAGSMQPKVEACLDFLDAGGERAVVTSLDRIGAAVDGDAGTQIYP